MFCNIMTFNLPNQFHMVTDNAVHIGLTARYVMYLGTPRFIL